MKSNNTVLICVTAQESSKALVAAGKAIADKQSADLEVVSVLPINIDESSANPKVIESLYSCAKDFGAKMAVYFSDDPILTVAAHIGKTKPLSLVVGFPGENSNDFVSLIHLLLPDLPISMVDGEKVYNILPFEAMSVKSV